MGHVLPTSPQLWKVCEVGPAEPSREAGPLPLSEASPAISICWQGSYLEALQAALH